MEPLHATAGMYCTVLYCTVTYILIKDKFVFSSDRSGKYCEKAKQVQEAGFSGKIQEHLFTF